MAKRYFIAKIPNTDKLSTYEPITQVLEWSVYSLDSGDVNSINQQASFAERVTELDKETAFFGLRHFADIRTTIKVPANEKEEQEKFDDLSYADMWVDSSKNVIPVTQKRMNTILRSMKFIAKLMIEDIYSKRFASLDEGASPIEKKVWEYQLDDLNNGTNFIIPELATAKGVTVDQLKTQITEKKAFYDKSVKSYYIQMTELKQLFNNCTTIRQLNVLFEDKMGIPMPQAQAEQEGRTYDHPNYGIIRKEVKPGISF